MQKNNYKLEGDIDFFAELQKSLLEEDDNDELELVCQITGLPLTDNHFKMKCGHVFNYDSLYTEICKQKFDFKTYTIDSISHADLKILRSANFDYFIKCPYCRSVQTDLLPYYENLSFPKKYGINTTDTAFKVMDNINHITNMASSNYTYKSYGYTFTKGSCCVTKSGVHLLPCYNQWVSEIPGLQKSYCPNHIRVVAKEYKLELKEKIAEEKATKKALEKENKALEKELKKQNNLLEKDLKKKTKLENKVIKQTAVIGEFVPDPEPGQLLCSAILKTGLRKGAECGLKCVKDGFCGKHSDKDKDKDKENK
jgi:hypothetical protein